MTLSKLGHKQKFFQSSINQTICVTTDFKNSTWQISVQNVISSFLILILLFVSHSLISFNFYLFYFPGAAAEPLGSACGTRRAPRSPGWEPLV